MAPGPAREAPVQGKAPLSLPQASFGEKGGDGQGRFEPTPGESHDFPRVMRPHGSVLSTVRNACLHAPTERAVPRLIPISALQGECYLLWIYRWGN